MFGTGRFETCYACDFLKQAYAGLVTCCLLVLQVCCFSLLGNPALAFGQVLVFLCFGKAGLRLAMLVIF